MQFFTSWLFAKPSFRHRPTKVKDRVLSLLSEGKIDAGIAKQLLGSEDGAAAHPPTRKRSSGEMTKDPDDGDSNDEVPEGELDALLDNANTDKKETCPKHVKKYFVNTWLHSVTW